eukprot:TRINITY_DN12236_c0_g1_i8.p1 TRINITY_DN12236_c0_g1~~TRINITY_DN12236_c0_g1_i8.p1  ORF type:complete len:202 (-),score=39.43 TRINITY_DN12236_c0_g1_i8:304-909(-)
MAGIYVLAEQDFTGPVVVTLVYFVLFQVFMVNQINGKIKLGAGDPLKANRFDYSNKYWEMADRSFMNVIEQTPQFLVSMWAFAVFCSAASAGRAGCVYLVARALFPVFWAVKGKWNLLIELSTQPCYAVINYFLVSLAYLAVTGKQFATILPDNAFLLILAIVGIHLACSVVVMGPGFLVATMLSKGFPEQEDTYGTMAAP